MIGTLNNKGYLNSFQCISVGAERIEQRLILFWTTAAVYGSAASGYGKAVPKGKRPRSC